MMKRNLFASKVLFICAMLTTQINAQDLRYNLSEDSLVNYYASQKRAYHATRLSERPKIDGQLNDECWDQGIWSAGFRQQQPNQAQEPSQQTEIKILYDFNNLYVGIRCFDNEPEKIQPILDRRDNFSGDIAGIALDTYNDKLTAFEFNVTAAGQKIDVVHLGAYLWDYNWDAVWEGKAHVGDSMWTVEMRIPFSQLRFADKEKHVWGMHIWRWIDRLDEEDQWKLIPIDAPAMVYIFGELHGIEGIQSKRKMELLPYAKAKYLPKNNSSWLNQGTDGKFDVGFGLDGKLGISSDFTLDFTINPDFGQVEADPSELNLTGYEIFYDEKRPFFLEGNTVLDYSSGDDMLFYSRRIGHAPSLTPGLEDGETIEMPENTSIINALKLTGKNKKGLSLGIINSMTAREDATITLSDKQRKETVEPFTNYFIGRVKQDINKGNTVIGGMLTSTQRANNKLDAGFLPNSSTVVGIDFQHNWKNKKYFVDLKSFYSDVAGDEAVIAGLQRSSRHYFHRANADHLEYDPTLTRLSGWGGELSGGKRSGKFRLTGSLNWRSPGVDLNDVGYLRQADFVQEKIKLRYQVNKTNKIFRSYYFTLLQGREWSYGMENTNNELDLHFYGKFKNLWLFHLDFDNNFNIFDTRELRGGPSLRKDNFSSAHITFQSNTAKPLMFAAGYNWDWSKDNITKASDYTFYFRWRINNQITLTSTSVYKKSMDNSQYVGQRTFNNEKRYLVGLLDRQTLYTTLKFEYFVSPELSLQYYGSPYASTGKYPNIRKVASAHASSLDERFEDVAVVGQSETTWHIDENGDNAMDYSIRHPEFDFNEFKSNFVARWEYRPGSTIYFVWTNTRSAYKFGYNDNILDSFTGIFDKKAQNAFMIKFNYWFSL